MKKRLLFGLEFCFNYKLRKVQHNKCSRQRRFEILSAGLEKFEIMNMPPQLNLGITWSQIKVAKVHEKGTDILCIKCILSISFYLRHLFCYLENLLAKFEKTSGI